MVVGSLAGCGDGRSAGPGEFDREVRYCQDQIFADAQQAPGMAFLDDRVWHSGSEEELHVGGLLSVPNNLQRPVYFDYECMFRNGLIVFARWE